jgi:NAD+ synthase (glutamine-hydrolysing)
MRKLIIAGATLNQTAINWKENRQNILAAIKEAKEQKVDILCLPELCITGYGCEDLFLSEWIYERAFSELMDILPFCSDIVVSIGLPVKLEGKAYNCSAMIENGKILGIYAKQNLANDGVHYEQRWFTPWPKDTSLIISFSDSSYEIGDLIYNLKGIKIGFEICEDAWVADRPGCRLHEKGVDLIINPSASHFAFGKSITRERLVIDSSRDFECTYLYTNLLGNEAGRMVYDGEILIAQKGQLIAQNEHLSFLPYQVIAASVNFDENKSEIICESNHLSKNESFERADALALYDYLRKSKSRGFVLSLSGGADSATCAVLVSSMVKIGTDTLGVDQFLRNIGQQKLITSLPSTDQNKFIVSKLLTCVYQASENSSEVTRSAAKALSNSIGASFIEWSIQDEVDSYSSKIASALIRELSWETDDIALQNIQARSRSPIIWMLANIKKALLLTTSNRSEGDVGYTTMDGDTSGSIAPIAAVDKPFIRQWLKWAERSLDYVGLQEVNAQAPTAELRPSGEHQTDEDDLMPYDIMVAIERIAIEQHGSPTEVLIELNGQKLAPKEELKVYISKFYRLWSINQWKRERLAPSFHLDDFNIDPKTWCRFPILSGNFSDEIEEMMNN